MSRPDEPPPDAPDVEHADVAAAEKASRWRNHPAVKAAGAVSELADQPQLFTICGAVLVAGLITRRPALAEAGGRMLLAMALVTAAKSAIKKRVSRTRPNVMKDQGRYERMAGGPDEGPWNSFPSGHTAGATATARALVRVYPGAKPWALAAATFTGAIQLPRGAHYPLDVAAGALLGLAAEWVVHRAFRGARPHLARVFALARRANDGPAPVMAAMAHPPGRALRARPPSR